MFTTRERKRERAASHRARTRGANPTRTTPRYARASRDPSPFASPSSAIAYETSRVNSRWTPRDAPGGRPRSTPPRWTPSSGPSTRRRATRRGPRPGTYSKRAPRSRLSKPRAKRATNASMMLTTTTRTPCPRHLRGSRRRWRRPSATPSRVTSPATVPRPIRTDPSGSSRARRRSRID